MENHKNKLQEYFQKKYLAIPKYNTRRTGGTDHQPEWISDIELYDGRKFTGSSKSTKSQAENSVAQICYNNIVGIVKSKSGTTTSSRTSGTSSSASSSTSGTSSSASGTSSSTGSVKPVVTEKCPSIYDLNMNSYNIIILVDADNCDVNLDASQYPKTLFIFFCAKNTTKRVCFQLQERYENCYVFISQSVGRDATDHLLTFTAGIIACANRITKRNPVQYILTKDHFGEYLERFTPNTKFICSIDDVLSQLS